jgi:DDE superfamily endonuclease
LQIVWENRLLRDNGSRCKITVDGTDFRIMEPSPFDPKWLSEKFNGPGVKYEIGVCIQTGWIVHVNGPYPCGEWNDLNVARDDLCFKLAESQFEDEMACADGGYSDAQEFFDTPTGHNNHDQRMKARARARHETINRRLKQWSVLGQRFRGLPQFHDNYFNAVANLTQFLIKHVGHEPQNDEERELFQVKYNDRISGPSVNHIPMADDASDDSDEE